MRFILAVFFIIFVLGFFIGYYFEKTSITYTKGEIETLKNDVENTQLQVLFASSEKECRLMSVAINDISYNLYNLVNKLKETNPDTEEFYKIKREADFLSMRAWILSRNVEERCENQVLPILFVYSTNCPECDQQDKDLQDVKNKYTNVLVYAVDYNLDETAVTLLKSAYEINSTPSMIIKGNLYSKLSKEELENIVCSSINCTSSVK